MKERKEIKEKQSILKKEKKERNDGKVNVEKKKWNDNKSGQL